MHHCVKWRSFLTNIAESISFLTGGRREAVLLLRSNTDWCCPSSIENLIMFHSYEMYTWWQTHLADTLVEAKITQITESGTFIKMKVWNVALTALNHPRATTWCIFSILGNIGECKSIWIIGSNLHQEKRNQDTLHFCYSDLKVWAPLLLSSVTIIVFFLCALPPLLDTNDSTTSKTLWFPTGGEAVWN